METDNSRESGVFVDFALQPSCLKAMYVGRTKRECGAFPDISLMRPACLRVERALQDTTSASMAWTLYLIAMNPDVQERLHKEVDQYLGDLEAFTLEDLKHLDLLERVTKESLRMRPSVPAIGRQLTEDAVIGGYSLKKCVWRELEQVCAGPGSPVVGGDAVMR